jgi:hypothetical protein
MQKCEICNTLFFYLFPDNNHLKGFLGQHKNVYNVYKRSVDPGKTEMAKDPRAKDPRAKDPNAIAPSINISFC